jgi:AcrR family transcriptional regulator
MNAVSSPPEDPSPGARRGRGRIDREEIVRAALRLIDAHGLEGLTMRKLGRELGVDAMAVYGYFDSKADLLDAIVEHEAARLREVADQLPTDAVGIIVAVAKHYHRVFLDHPNLAALLASRPLPQEETPEIMVASVQLLQAVGIPDDRVPLAAATISSYFLGYILYEATRGQSFRALGDEFADQQRRQLVNVGALAGDTALARQAIARRLEEGAADEEFEAGIRALIEGFRSGDIDPGASGLRDG